MLVRSVQCCSESPSLICVAARKGHKIDPLIRDSRSFAIGFVDPEDKLIRRRFLSTDAAPVEHPGDEDHDPFDAVETTTLETGSPILVRCTTWFDCEVMRRVDLEAEMELFVGVVVSVMHAGETVKIDRVVDQGEVG
jgi:flavin reductase (DIM6/NTAB) family NADH-FMN oxidoreductase RutF